jgi:hypothetical protein
MPASGPASPPWVAPGQLWPISGRRQVTNSLPLPHGATVRVIPVPPLTRVTARGRRGFRLVGPAAPREQGEECGRTHRDE